MSCKFSILKSRTRRWQLSLPPLLDEIYINALLCLGHIFMTIFIGPMYSWTCTVHVHCTLYNVHGFRSMGPGVSKSDYNTLCRLNWCDSGWWRYQLTFLSHASGAIWWPTLEPIKVLVAKFSTNEVTQLRTQYHGSIVPLYFLVLFCTGSFHSDVWGPSWCFEFQVLICQLNKMWSGKTRLPVQGILILTSWTNIESSFLMRTSFKRHRSASLTQGMYVFRAQGCQRAF